MADVLPTYEAATSKNPWPLIARYVRVADAARAAQASSTFEDAFMNVIWDNPTKTFPNRASGPWLDRAKRWLRCLMIARNSTRERIHTLDLSALAEDHLPGLDAQDFQSKAFLTDGFPNLRCLRIPARFDRVLALVKRNSAHEIRFLDISAAASPSTGLKLLRSDIQESLSNLIYLDLSYIRIGPYVPDLLKVLVERNDALQILKLREIGLTNADAGKIAETINMRVWSLDLRDNKLTDVVVEELWDCCFPPPLYGTGESTPSEKGDPAEFIRWILKQKSKRRVHGQSSFHDIDDDEKSRSIRRLSDSHYIDPLRREPTGVTHLRISGNSLGHQAFASLLNSQNLVAFDCGDHTPSRSDTGLICAQNLFKSLKVSQPHLRYLRVCHEFITGRSSHYDNLNNGSGKAQKDPDLTKPDYNTRYALSLETLVLTNVPQESKRGHLFRSLVNFLKDAAFMESVEISLSGKSMSSSCSQCLLRSLILEMASLEAFEDDSVAFEESMKEDFSFFPDEREGSGESDFIGSESARFDESKKVVAEALSEFRATTKAAFDSAVRQGGKPQPSLYGHWSGTVRLEYQDSFESRLPSVTD